MLAFLGRYYEFHKERIVSRPGAPVFARPGLEIGPEISQEEALRRVNKGLDVYTLGKEDAYKLAMQVAPQRPVLESPHRPTRPTQSGRDDVYYPHYHPGGLHPGDGGPGHVFFGDRGQGLG
jgi:hypothetical protein